MERWLSQPSLSGLLGTVVASLSIGTLFLIRQLSKDSKKNHQDDKALLKELLEGFGLEVPEELQDTHNNIIETIKTP